MAKAKKPIYLTFGEIICFRFATVVNTMVAGIFLFIILGHHPLFAQNSKPKFKFEHLPLDLNNNSVESIIQDSYGYIWIGTLGGLHRYDGVSVTTYLKSEDSTSLTGNRQGRLFERRFKNHPGQGL